MSRCAGWFYCLLAADGYRFTQMLTRCSWVRRFRWRCRLRGRGETGRLEGVREVAWPLGVRLVVFAVAAGGCAQVIRLEVLFLMGCCRCRGYAVPGPHGDLRVLCQGLLIEQARSQALPTPTFVNGLVFTT